MASLVTEQYIPDAESKVKLTYENGKAATYENNSKENIVNINIQSEPGILLLNTVSNYNTQGETLAAFKNEEKLANLDMNVEARVVTYKSGIINNTSEKVEGIKTLGRFPNEGNKGIKSGEDLGSTVNTTLKSVIEVKTRNGEKVNAEIYYSDNINATEDLENIENGWTKEAKTNSKSYLIVLDEISAREVLEFSYNVEIPANLGANEKVIGTYALYSKTTILEAPLLRLETQEDIVAEPNNEQNEAVGNAVEKSNIKAEMSSSVMVHGEYVETAEVGARITYSIKITNARNSDIEGVKFTDYLPEGAGYYRAILYGVNDEVLGLGTYNESNKTVTVNIEKIEKGAAYSILVIAYVEEYKGKDFINKAEVTCSEVLGEDKIELEVVDKVASPIEITAAMSSPTAGATIKAGDKVEYGVSITNKGQTTARVKIEDSVPEQLQVTEIQAKIGDKTLFDGKLGNSITLLDISIKQGETLDLKILAIVNEEIEAGEIKNSATISGTTIEAVTTNTIIHLIKEETSSTPTPTRPEEEGLKIAGTAWIDANGDGKQEEGEDVLKGVTVKLINVANRTIHKK